jgi:hypothetical protein
MKSIVVFLLILIWLTYSLPLNLLFWNLRTFGKGRATENHGKELADITQNYDIILFAEIKDAECSKDVNCPIKKFFEKHFPSYQLYLSPPLYYDTPFKKSGSEQYAILVKKTISSIHMIEYPDKETIFIRRPFGIEISDKVKILLFHSHPNSEKELLTLSEVFRFFGNRKTILLGDLNTGCHYVGFERLNEFDIGKDFDWLISENIFTNYEQTCPYDRILATKDISHSCKDGFVLNQSNEAKRIDSDHYPIGIHCDI